MILLSHYYDNNNLDLTNGYINQFLTGWKRYPQNIQTEYVREIPIGHN